MLYKHPCAIIALALTCAVVFTHGAWRYGFMDVVAWGGATAVLSVVLFPAQRRNQPGLHARRDAARGILRDPLAWAGVLLLAFTAVQALNNGRPMEYDVPGARWVYGAPPWRGFPSSLDAGAAWRMFFSFLPAVAMALCARHGLTASGRAAYLGLLAVLSACVGAWELGVNVWLGGQTDGWRVFANADHGGTWLLLCFMVSVVAWGHACAAGWPAWRRTALAACAALDVLGIAALRAPVALLLAGVAGVPLTLAVIAATWKSLAPARRALALGMVLVALPLVVAVTGLGMYHTQTPDGERVPFAQKIFKEERELRTEVVGKMARDHRLLGVGAGNYPYFSRVYWPPKRLRDFPRLGVAVDNDFAQTRAELGAAGCALLLAALAFIVFHRPSWRLWKGAPFTRKGLCVVFMAGLAVVFAAAWVESPFRSPPVLVTMAAALACAPCFLWNPLAGEDAI